MKAIENMTLSEIRELKRKRRYKFRKLMEKYLKEHPEGIDYIGIFRSDLSYMYVKLKGENI